LLFALVLVFSVAPLYAQRRQNTIVIRLASPVPENTPWGYFLNQIANDWSRITSGLVELRIFHGGTAGNEKDVVRNLRTNQLQAAVLSTYGLYEISPEVMTLSSPFLIRNDEELDLVLGEVREGIEKKISDAGFYTLAWARVGWVRFFSKQPVFTPDDLKRQRLGTNADQAEMNRAFREMGFQMIDVARHDILVALNSNMVDAVFSSPVAVGSTQIFGLARNMASINIAPFIGAIVFNQHRGAWRAVPDRYKPLLIDSIRRHEATLDIAIRQLEDDLISTMGNHGLTTNQLTPEQEQLWYDEAARALPRLLGTLFDRELFGRIEAILKEHRNRR